MGQSLADAGDQRLNGQQQHTGPLSEAERHTILFEWNQTSRAFPSDRCLHELIEEQVERTPDAVAVVSGSKQLTYGELNRRANQLARHIRALGVRSETLVGITADRSMETVIALLAVLKAGGAYVPLDPNYPADRLRYLLDDSQVSVLLTQEHVRSRIPAEGLSIVCLDTDWPEIAAQSAENPAPLATPDHLAYVIYTSGSTGAPKGVLVPHRQIVHSTSAQFAYDRPAPSAFLLLISFSFDASAVGIYWTLCSGGRLVIPSEEQVKDPGLARRLIAEQQITHQDCTPALYSLILGTDATPLKTMQYVIVGGETCPPHLVAEHHRLAPQTRLANNYGPTEATVWSTTLECAEQHSQTPVVPIGRPIPNARIYLLDDHLNPVPIGALGELYIGGAGVARGYLRRPDLTADRFVPNPFALEPGERLYRTGDSARYLPDGNIEFQGRVDYQVKIRGFRIELEEIEAALLRHPALAEAVVEAREDSPGDKRLVAYVTTRAGNIAPSREELVAFLDERLPQYMVPRAFVFIDRLPRTVTGKVDRQALPVPDTQRSDADESFVTPRTPLEEEIARTFATVLGVEKVGVHDNFFDLGGNSLLIAQLALQLWGTYSFDLPVMQLFKVPTVAGVAHLVETFQREGRERARDRWDFERLEAEAELDPAITPEGLPLAPFLEPANILLTGATGYLGAFLLERLLQVTHAEVYCLVRASGPAEGFERIKNTLKLYRIWDESVSARIHPVVGDLAQPLLGLTPTGFAELAATVDAIYHTGALVNFVFPYSALKPANVQGTEEILRLATQVKVKAVHYVSTIDVFLQTDIARPFMEDAEIQPLDVPDGYARSKWVAERLALKARDRGLPISIYRPGMMMSHTKTGATQTNDYLLVEIKGFLQYGMAPEADLVFDAIPVDYAAQAIVHLSLNEQSVGKIFHMWNQNPTTVNDVFTWIRARGYKLDVVPFETVFARVMTDGLDPSSPLYPLIPLFLDEEGRGAPAAFDLKVLDTIDFKAECANTLKGLEGSGIECPPMTEELARLCFDYLIDVGFLERPDAKVLAEVTAGA